MKRTWKDSYHPSWGVDGEDILGNYKDLTSLKGAPTRVTRNFFCQDNPLTSLEGAPVYVGENFLCSNCSLVSLKGAPAHVGLSFDCSRNNLVSLEGAPSHIGTSLYCYANKITSLHNIHQQIKHIGEAAYFEMNPIKSHVLGLLLIDGLRAIMMGDKRVQGILSKHLPSKGMESVLEAQEELILAGLEEFARL